jgi:TonB family protein
LTRPLAISAIINVAIIYLLVLLTGYLRISVVQIAPMFATILVPVPPLEYHAHRQADHEPFVKESAVRETIHTTQLAQLPVRFAATVSEAAPRLSTVLHISTGRPSTAGIPSYNAGRVTGPSTVVKTGVLGSPEGVIPNRNANTTPTLPTRGAAGFATDNHDAPTGGVRQGSVRQGSVKLVGIGSGLTTNNHGPSGRLVRGSLPNAVVVDYVRTSVRGTSATDVKVLGHPIPTYTTEAKDLRIQGQVVLLVQFGASGKVKVLGVVSSLGHGLDEEAIQVAENTTFTPATVGGNNVDLTTHYRVDFQTLN